MLNGKNGLPGVMQQAADRNFLVQGLTCLVLVLLPVFSWGADAGLNWSIAPYFWASDTEYDLKASGTPVDAGTVTFDDLLDTTDASFQIITEAGFDGGKWSAFVDVTYLDTSDDYSGRFFKVDSDSEQWFVDAAVAWWPQGESGGLSLFAGGRYTDLEDQLDFRLAENGQRVWLLDNDRDFLDVLVGIRKHFTLSESWKLLTHADYSFGDSEGTYQLQALVRYGVGAKRQHGLMLGYRYKEAEFKHGDIEEEYTYKGPLLAFSFRL